MTDIAIVRIDPAPDAEIEPFDKRIKSVEIWAVPVTYLLADDYTVDGIRKVFGSRDDAEAFAASLPIVPTKPMRARFNEDDELQLVITRA